MKPFLKWAGSKYRIIETIRTLLPAGRRLIEPFCGSGAVFLNTDYERFLLNDVNRDLIDLYRIVQEDGRTFISEVRDLFCQETNRPEVYYQFREEYNRTTDLRRKAALLIYLNRHGYNGLYRMNQKGIYNVPFGRYKAPHFPEAELLAFECKSQQAVFTSEPFEQILQRAVPGDVVYADPPYVPLSDTARFTNYSAGGFTAEQQKILAEMGHELSKRGVPVLISNHRTPYTLELYAAARVKSIEVQRFISRDGSNRGKASEVLALFS